MTTDRELMQQALDYLEGMTTMRNVPESNINKIIHALRTRLAQPEQEIEPDRPHVEDDGCPTEKAVLQRFWREHQMQDDGYCQACEDNYCTAKDGCVARDNPPPQREWQGLTDEEKTFLAWESNNGPECVAMTEAKLKEKNT